MPPRSPQRPRGALPATSSAPAHTAAALAALASLALTAVPAAAQTGSSVQLYGIVDAGIEHHKTGVPGQGSQRVLNGGNMAASRLGFRGAEDLGGGLKAVFNLELGLHMASGAIVSLPDEPGAFFARRSVVGLQGRWGELMLGRDYTPAFWTIVQTDRFRYGLPGTISTPSQVSSTRASRGVFYVSPAFAGVTVRLAATRAAESDTGPHQRGQVYAGSLDYRSGPLFLSGALLSRRDTVPGSTTDTTPMHEGGLGGEYKAGSWTFNAGHWRTNQVTATAGAVDASRAYWLGTGYQFGANQINVQLTRTNVQPFARDAGHALTYGVAWLHALSARTTLYAAYGGVRNSDNARLALNTGSQRTGGAVFGADPSALVLGTRHAF